MLLNVKKVLAISVLTAISSGCASKGSISSDLSPERFNDDAIVEMKNAAIEARDELRLLAKVRDGVAQKIMTQPQRVQRFEQATSVPKGFERIVTIPPFTGTIDKALILVSKLAGYSYGTPEGLPPRTPMMVTLGDVKNPFRNKPLNEALKELGMQTGDGALIKVLPKDKRIVLQYTDTDNKAR